MGRRYSKRDYAAYVAAKAGILIISCMPARLVLWIGRAVGMSMYHLHPRRKKIAYANIKSAFSEVKPPSEIKRILRQTYLNYGQNIMENASSARIGGEYIKKYVTMDRKDRIDAAFKRGRGCIFLTSHFGNWNIMMLKGSDIGYPMHALYRPTGLEKIDELIVSHRESLGCTLIKRGMGMRRLIRVLREGGVLGMIGDQDVGKAGVFVDLLGRPASFATGTPKLVRETGASIVPSYIIRRDGPHHEIKIEEPFTVEKTDDERADIRRALERYASGLEKNIKAYPGHWMWTYTRWKSSPVRRVVVLSDGKQGHLNQSMAALKVIKRCRADAGFSEDDTRVDVIEIRYKDPARRAVLALFARLASHAWQGNMSVLEACLEPASYRRLESVCADIVISCGSSLAPVNAFLARECNAKNVVMMKPGVTGLGSFSVAVIPEHDRPTARDNVAVTKGAPAAIDGAAMSDGARRIAATAGLSGAGKVGLLVGGDTSGHKLGSRMMEKIITQLKGYVERKGMELLVTTSRRTPRDVEELLKREFAAYPRCGLLVIANEKNMANVVGGILSLSDITLVSGESVSMVSEAASSGKKTLVFGDGPGGGRTKHAEAIKRLASEGYIASSGADEVGRTLWDISEGKYTFRKLDNEKAMYEKLLRVI